MNFTLENLDKLTAGDIIGKKKFVKLFISEMKDNEVPALLKASLIKDEQLLLAKAHSIKSNVRFFGLHEITSRLQKLEDNPNLFITPEVAQEIEQISAKILSVCEEMNTWCNIIEHA